MNNYSLDSDNGLNQQLQEEVQTLRGGMLGVAEKQKLPLRFITRTDTEKPGVIITDIITNREVSVSLFAYREVREVLNVLFS